MAVTTKPHEPEPKKPYAAPRVIAYGSVSVLTQSRLGSGADANPSATGGRMEMV
jgi:hypothetical protein